MASSAVCGHCERMITTAHVGRGLLVNCSLCNMPFHSYCKNIEHPLLEGLTLNIVHVICEPCLDKHIHTNGNVTSRRSHSVQTQYAPADQMVANKEPARPKTRSCLRHLSGYCKFGRYCKRDHRICWTLIETGRCNYQCKYSAFHLEVCSGSKEYLSCFDLDCERIHLKGTKRFPDKTTSSSKPEQTQICPSPSIETEIESPIRISPTPKHGSGPISAKPSSPTKEKNQANLHTHKTNAHLVTVLSEKSESVHLHVDPQLQRPVGPPTPNPHLVNVQPENANFHPIRPVGLPSPHQLSNSVSSLQNKVSLHLSRLQVNEKKVGQLLQVLTETVSGLNSLRNSLTLNEERVREMGNSQTTLTSQVQQLNGLIHSHSPFLSDTNLYHSHNHMMNPPVAESPGHFIHYTQAQINHSLPSSSMPHQPAMESQGSHNLYTQAQVTPSLPSNHTVNQPISQHPAPSSKDHTIIALEQFIPSAPPCYMIDQPASLCPTNMNQDAQVIFGSSPEISNHQNFTMVHHAPSPR